jgi:hypothetical protein
MTTFRPEIIEKFANRLYARSAGVIVASTLIGVVLGYVVDPFIQSSLPPKISTALPSWSSAVLFGILGALQGFERSSLLKLQAQIALCQLQIERNTRSTHTPVA